MSRSLFRLAAIILLTLASLLVAPPNALACFDHRDCPTDFEGECWIVCEQACWYQGRDLWYFDVQCHYVDEGDETCLVSWTCNCECLPLP